MNPTRRSQSKPNKMVDAFTKISTVFHPYDMSRFFFPQKDFSKNGKMGRVGHQRWNVSGLAGYEVISADTNYASSKEPLLTVGIKLWHAEMEPEVKQTPSRNCAKNWLGGWKIVWDSMGIVWEMLPSTQWKLRRVWSFHQGCLSA